MKKPTMSLFGVTKTVILVFTGIFGAALFFFGHGALELLGLIACASVCMLGLIDLWFYLDEKNSNRCEPLDLVKQILARHQGGIFKRIDENRELLAVLQREAPELLAKQPWIVGWLKSQDSFLCDLESAVPLSDVQFPKRTSDFPRPWPLGTKA